MIAAFDILFALTNVKRASVARGATAGAIPNITTGRVEIARWILMPISAFVTQNRGNDLLYRILLLSDYNRSV